MTLTERETALSTFGVPDAPETIAAGLALQHRMGDPYAPAPGVSWDRHRATSVLAEHDLLDAARDVTVAGVPVRRIEPSWAAAAGTYVHIHGGGWCLGSHRSQDRRLQALADATGLRVLSVGYRLAPEHPFPGCLDDCLAVAESVTADPGFHAIGGESAGAHLAASVLLRMRDRGTGGFAAAVLTFGCFDLAGTPGAGDGLQCPLDLLLPDVPRAGRRDPALSPLYAPLHGMPPVRLLVGTRDRLLDDTLMLAARWQVEAPVELDVVAGAHHAFTLQDIAVTREARRREHAFLANCRTSVVGSVP